MAFWTLTWVAGSPTGTADAAVRAAVDAAGTDGAPRVAEVVLRTWLVDADHLDTDVLLDELDRAIDDPDVPLRQYFLVRAPDESRCGGYLSSAFDPGVAAQITRNANLPFDRRAP